MIYCKVTLRVHCTHDGWALVAELQLAWSTLSLLLKTLRLSSAKEITGLLTSSFPSDLTVDEQQCAAG